MGRHLNTAAESPVSTNEDVGISLISVIIAARSTSIVVGVTQNDFELTDSQLGLDCAYKWDTKVGKKSLLGW